MDATKIAIVKVTNTVIIVILERIDLGKYFLIVSTPFCVSQEAELLACVYEVNTIIARIGKCQQKKVLKT